MLCGDGLIMLREGGREVYDQTEGWIDGQMVRCDEWIRLVTVMLLICYQLYMM